jgi:hypothetical protein
MELMTPDGPVSISVSFAGVQQRPGPYTEFHRAWSRMQMTTAGRAATDLESVLGNPQEFESLILR